MHIRFVQAIWVLTFACFVIFDVSLADSQESNPDYEKLKHADVEGVTEYRLPNGCRVLIYPDNNSQVLTVNMTVLVGSRHEGYGESGMAHLLEHMLFKGTPKHPDLLLELKQRGATDMNGTTWYDRTNFYETLPASIENLDWALEIEADRLINCYIRGEDLASEMTVVRSEFEMRENSPEETLGNRVSASAFDWHNYGKAVIGSQADIERVPLPALRAFYRKYYRPDNIVVTVTGNVDQNEVLALCTKHFSPLENPRESLVTTYTQEPTQDGERVVYVRRTGGAATLQTAYHIPSVSHEDFAALKVLANVMGSQPSGLLYQEFVKSGVAAKVSASAIEACEPGVFTISASLTTSMSAESKVEYYAKQLIAFTEKDLLKAITDENVASAKAQILQGFEDAPLNAQSFATTLSDWIAYGDWRLFFITRDRTSKVTTDDVKRVATRYLIKSNRTLGIYLPTETPQRSVVPVSPDVEQLANNYKSTRETISISEKFEATPVGIKQRLMTGQLQSGIKYSMLPKLTRGDIFHLKLTLDFGSQSELNDRATLLACEIAGPAMTMGTEELTHEQIDELQTKLKCQIGIESAAGTVTVEIQGRKEKFKETMDLLYQLIRKPKYSDESIELIKNTQANQLLQYQNNPDLVAQISVNRALNPVDRNNHQYIATIPEVMQDLETIDAETVRKIYSMLSGSHGNVTLLGAFDPELAKQELNRLLSDWNAERKFERLSRVSMDVSPETIELITPDQSSASYMQGANLDANINDPDWEALMIATDIIGGSSLESRLNAEVRGKKGISYQVGCGFEAGVLDRAGRFITFASMNPKNKSAVIESIQTTFDKVKNDGLEDSELQNSKNAYVQTIKASLADDAYLTGLLHRFQIRGATMDDLSARLVRVEALTLEDVNKAAVKLLSSKSVIVLAGDFAESDESSKKE